MEDYISAITGVLGTILGTFLGYFLNNLGNKGKLSFYDIKCKEEFLHDDKWGQQVPTKHKKEVKYYEVIIDFIIYNNSNIPKIMTDIKLEFLKGKNIITEITPKDYSTRRISANSTVMDILKFVNITPKIVSKVSIYGWLQMFDNFWNVDTILIRYKNEKGKKKYIKIKNKNVLKMFENKTQ